MNAPATIQKNIFHLGSFRVRHSAKSNFILQAPVGGPSSH